MKLLFLVIMLPVLVLFMACEADENPGDTAFGDGDTDSDSDGDTDTDTDGDTDTDTDADTDGDGDSDTDADTDTDTDTDEDDGCPPGEVKCEGGIAFRCVSSGLGWEQIDDCKGQNLECVAGECLDVSSECAVAMKGSSYIGCEYFAVTLANASLNYDEYGDPITINAFFFAVAIANDSTSDAQIVITDGPGGTVNNNYTVPGGQMLVVENLPWKSRISSPAQDDLINGQTFATRKVSNSAYRITSSRPVTVYQFNPLDYQRGFNYSYTNDASLLLPAHILRDEYIAMSRATMTITSGFTYSSEPGFVAIVGRAEGPTTVEITYTAHTLPSDNQSNENFPAFSPGEVQTVTIQPYEVYQILSGNPGEVCPGQAPCGNYNCCKNSEQYDLTGTSIKVLSGPNPAVFGGHNCSFVPYDKYACDHLEQQMFPLETLGTEYLCVHHTTQHPNEPTIWRILSGSAANQVTITTMTSNQTQTLNKGQYVEFKNKEDFQVVGTGRLSIAQFMVGQNYTSIPPDNGDPAMALAVPVEQYRLNYTFLAPQSYVQNYLTVIYKTGMIPVLDGVAVAGDTAQINGEYSRTKLLISGGIHHIESSDPFAITVYGVGRFTSYMYPGGLDLKPVPVVI
jgi:IgGFc binding protein